MKIWIGLFPCLDVAVEPPRGNVKQVERSIVVLFPARAKVFRRKRFELLQRFFVRIAARPTLEGDGEYLSSEWVVVE